MPAARQRSRSPTSTFAVNAMIGVRRRGTRSIELTRADGGGRFEPVHARHVAVHEEHIECTIACQFQRDAAIVGNHVAAVFLQHSLTHEPADLVVFDQQRAEVLCRPPGERLFRLAGATRG